MTVTCLNRADTQIFAFTCKTTTAIVSTASYERNPARGAGFLLTKQRRASFSRQSQTPRVVYSPPWMWSPPGLMITSPGRNALLTPSQVSLLKFNSYVFQNWKTSRPINEKTTRKHQRDYICALLCALMVLVGIVLELKWIREHEFASFCFFFFPWSTLTTELHSSTEKAQRAPHISWSYKQNFSRTFHPETWWLLQLCLSKTSTRVLKTTKDIPIQAHILEFFCISA